MNVYHYTTGIMLKKIQDDGFIAPTLGHHKDDRARAVWFTLSEEWEATAGLNRLPPIDWSDDPKRARDILERDEDGLYRICVGSEMIPYNFEHWIMRGNPPKKELRYYLKTVLKLGSRIELWRCSFEPVPSIYFRRIDKYINGE